MLSFPAHLEILEKASNPLHTSMQINDSKQIWQIMDWSVLSGVFSLALWSTE